MRGLGRIFKRGSVYWIAYYHRGKEYRESSESENESQARKLLKKRLGEINAGRFIPNENRLSFEDMVKDLENDYKINGKRSLSTALFRVSHVRRFFGLDRAVDITPDRVRAYQAHRLAEGASNGTVNREVTILSRMLSLAFNAGQLSRKARFQMLEENNVREGFLDHGSFLVLLDNLRDCLRPLMEFLYLSGWRIGEATNLTWSDVDPRRQDRKAQDRALQEQGKPPLTFDW
jgi:integrase